MRSIPHVLITGGTGFIGHHLWEYIAERHPDWECTIIDCLDYPGNLQRLTELEAFKKQYAAKKVRFIHHDIRSPIFGNEVLMKQIGRVDYIIHLAAQTCVDRSVERSEPFIATNVIGTFHLLEFARSMPKLQAYVQISTDEVYGEAPPGVSYTEWQTPDPSNPYAATKAGADALVIAYCKSYKVPGLIVRSVNNYGERQHPEKFIPKALRSIIEKKPVIIHGNKREIGSRCWIHPKTFTHAILYLIKQGIRPGGDIVHISGKELTNLEIAERIAEHAGVKLHYRLVDFHKARPSHDRRYVLDDSYLRSMGWSEPLPFERTFGDSIEWMLRKEHRVWLGLDT